MPKQSDRSAPDYAYIAAPWEIPASWAWSQMGKIGGIVGGGTPKTTDPANFHDGNIPWITPADLSGYTGKFIGRGARNITEKGFKSSSTRFLPSGTVLFSSRAPIGYVAIASQPVTTNQGFKSFVLPKVIDSSYVYYYLLRSKELVEELGGGTTFKEISGARAARIPLVIAPLPEQHRIVAEIEKQLTRLDASVAALERVRANLEALPRQPCSRPPARAGSSPPRPSLPAPKTAATSLPTGSCSASSPSAAPAGSPSPGAAASTKTLSRPTRPHLPEAA